MDRLDLNGFPDAGNHSASWEPAPRNPRTEEQLFKEQITQGINFDRYEHIPVTTAGHDVPMPIKTFEESDLHMGIKWIIKNLAKYSNPTPVQKYAIPILSAGRDLMACAQTGSGKTGAYLLPILSNIYKEGPRPSSSGRSSCGHPLALILTPTRELATQVHKEALKFSYRSFVRPVVIYGGVPAGEQLYSIEAGCDLLIATPGRLIDFLERRKISLSKCRYLILDEADRMLDMGFEIQVREIVQNHDMPDLMNRQTAMYSATFPKPIQMLACDFLKREMFIFMTVGRIGSTTENIKQEIVYVPHNRKTSKLVEVLEQEKLTARKYPQGQYLVLVFVRTKRQCDQLVTTLKARGLQATTIHGDLPQTRREQALDSFRHGRQPIMVATDVFQRGMDVPNVMHVIQVDLPAQIDEYVHRIGRTGRAGNMGKATSFYNEENIALKQPLIETLEETGQPVPDFLKRSAMGGSMYSGGGGSRTGGNHGGFGASGKWSGGGGGW
ncbi:P-loop containing nucleoside triphosphate hydrolase protein [Gaertneriomyces semiglobifer]|nr:P-loop containing nucleoside triphosphate hydrolase protein [Gaertneriomyces semiglobifer]